MRLCPLKTPKQPAELRRVAVTPAGESGRRLAPCRFLYSRFFLLASFHLMGVARWPRAVQRHQVLEENSRRVLRQDEWRAVPLESTGKSDPCPLKRNASGNWGSRGVSPLAGSRGRPRVEGLGREASLPSLAFWELFLHRKSSPRGVGNGVSPHHGRAGRSPATGGGRRRRPKGVFSENYRSPPARVSLYKEVRRGGAPPHTGGPGNARPRQRAAPQGGPSVFYRVTGV